MTNQDKLRWMAQYIGVAVINYQGDDIGLLTGIIHDSLEDPYDYVACTDYMSQELDKCKLSLTPLSQLTEEDAEEVFGYSGAEVWKNQMGTWMVMHSNGGVVLDHHREQLLLEKGYALPWKGQDPFELGWAVEKERSE